MTFNDIFKSSFLEKTSSFSILDMSLALLLAFALGLFIFAVYRKTFNGVMYSASFGVSLMAMTLITTLIILAVTSNVILSLGMVGALSIVRFRTAIKDSRDTIFLFFAITEGLCVGSQNFRLAVVTTLFIGILITCASLLPAMRPKYLYIVRGGADPIDAGVLREVLSVHTKDFRFRSSGLDKTHQEFIMEVRLKEADTTALCEKLSLIPGVTAVNWISESGENLG